MTTKIDLMIHSVLCLTECVQIQGNETWTLRALKSLSLCWSANVSIYCLTGIVLGVVLKTFVPMSNLTIHYMGFPGEVFMRVLQMVTIPLMVTSVITGATFWTCHVIITIYHTSTNKTTIICWYRLRWLNIKSLKVTLLLCDEHINAAIIIFHSFIT